MPPVIRRAEKEHRLATTLGQSFFIPKQKALAINCIPANMIAADFAKSIEESLHSDGGPPSSLTSDLHRQVDSVLLISKEVAASRSHELDRQGTRLWNLASKYKSHRSANPELLCLRMLFRLLTYCLCLRAQYESFPVSSLIARSA